VNAAAAAKPNADGETPQEGRRALAGEDRGRQIARTFWGKAWCDNLESYRDYENRLPRGHLRAHGSVVDLQIAPREVTAIVSGSKIYKGQGQHRKRQPGRWKTLCADCSGGIDSWWNCCRGNFPKG
jgi:hypothetical protein